LRSGQIAKGTPRCCASFAKRHAAFDIFRGNQIEMRLDLVGEIAVEAIAKMQSSTNL
jgi:hypothetical protein